MLRVASKIQNGVLGEDRALIRDEGDQLIVVVADGAGGTGGGAAAAQMVCDAIDRMTSSVSWTDVLSEIDATIVRSGTGGFSTAVVAEIQEGSVRGASVGDSGAWLVGPSGLTELTDGQRRKPLLGSGTCRPTAFGPVDLDGRLLVASDGLFKYAPRERIRRCAIAGPVDHAVQALVDAVRLPSGRFQDDVAVVLVLAARERYALGEDGHG